MLFSEGDFIITTLTNVRGIIEVKSKITSSTFAEVLNQFDNSISQFNADIQAQERKLFLGIFSFETNSLSRLNNIENALRNSNRLVNHISLGSNYFLRHWTQEEGLELNPPINGAFDFYNFYKINNMSFSYFVSNLLHIVCEDLDDRYWFSFPIAGTKEINRVQTIFLSDQS